MNQVVYRSTSFFFVIINVKFSSWLLLYKVSLYIIGFKFQEFSHEVATNIIY